MKKLIILLFYFCIYINNLFGNIGYGFGLSLIMNIDTSNPQVTVNQPNTLDHLLAGQEYLIRWSASDTNLSQTPITISYTTRDSENSIITDYENTSSFIWEVPNELLNTVRVWVEVVDQFGNIGNDSSDVCFNIVNFCNCGLSPILKLDTVDPTVELLGPNGNEIWYFEEIKGITWQANDSNFSMSPIDLSYNLNGGMYQTIRNSIDNSGIYEWLVPELNSNNVRVKIVVTDDFGNTSSDLSTNSFCITYPPLKPPQNISLSVVNSFDAIISWNSVRQTIINTDIVPTWYIVLFNGSNEPDNSEHYFVLAVVEDTVFTHLGVARFSEQMFYRVIAYKDHSSSLRHPFWGEYLISGKNPVLAGRQNPLKWEDAEKIMFKYANVPTGLNQRRDK